MADDRVTQVLEAVEFEDDISRARVSQVLIMVEFTDVRDTTNPTNNEYIPGGFVRQATIRTGGRL